MMKYIKQIREHFTSRTFFRVRDAAVFLSGSGISRGYLKLLLAHLEKKGEITRISRGVYTFQDDASVAGFAFSPFYYGLQEALSIRDLWEQETNPVVITPRRVRQGVRSSMGTNIVVRRIAPEMFFGFEIVKYHGLAVPVSDVEKTLIDFVHFREPLSDEALAEIRKRVRRDVLAGYLKRVPLRTRSKVLGLLSRARAKP